MTTELVPPRTDWAPAAYDAVTLAILRDMEQAAEEDLESLRPQSTKNAYKNDWNLWQEFHAWLADHTGHALPLTAVTKGTMVGFVSWLDQVKEAAPNSIERRITGVTVTLRRPPYNLEVPKVVTTAAREKLRRIREDPDREDRGRGQAPATDTEQLARMTASVADNLTGIRDRALFLMSFSIAGRSAEVSRLNVTDVVLGSKGLAVRVPPVKGRPERKNPVTYGDNPDTCPVRAWLTWKTAAGLTSGPAFLPIDRWGHMGNRRMSPAACREVIARGAQRAGLDIRLTGHSQRSGFITASRLAGKREELIRAQSGHAENSPVFWRYIREADAWADPATKGIGL